MGFMRLLVSAVVAAVALAAVAHAAVGHHHSNQAKRPSGRLDATIRLRGGTVNGRTPTGAVKYHLGRKPHDRTFSVSVRNVVPFPSTLDVTVDGKVVGAIRVTDGSGSVTIHRPIKVSVRASSIALKLHGTNAIILKSFQHRTGNDLFVVQAARGSLTGGILKLAGVPPASTYFGDRPSRRTGTFATADMVKHWAAVGFASDPPNAALSITNGRKDADTVIVELRKPHYAAGTLSFRVKQLSTISPGMSYMKFRADPAVPQHFGPAALFIDSDGWQDCWGQLYNTTQHTYNLSSSNTDSNSDWGTKPDASVGAGDTTAYWESESSTFHACHAGAAYADATGNGDSISTATYTSEGGDDNDAYCTTTGNVACSCYAAYSPTTDDWVITYYVGPPGSEYVLGACFNGQVGGG